MPEPFRDMISGGHHNSLGRTQEVVETVVADESRLEELFDCLDSDDELVRMRAGDALEKVCRSKPEWFAPQVERLLTEIGAIDQPSVQWHVAQMLERLRPDLSSDQASRATDLLKRNLTESSDWIVLNVTMDVLANWAQSDPHLASWLVRRLTELAADDRKSVAKRASTHLSRVERPD